ncbi:MAG: cyclic nucleotide-binding domain-containing protein [Acidobacteriota bacterium]
MDPTELQSALADHPLFRGLAPEGIAGFAERGDLIETAVGDALVREGQDADSLLVVLSGELKVTKKGSRGFPSELGKVSSGAVLGEVGLLGGGKRTATAKAVEASRAFSLSREDFEAMVDAGDLAARQVLLRLARTMAERQQATSERLAEMAEKVEHPDGTMRLSVTEIRERLLQAVSDGI